MKINNRANVRKLFAVPMITMFAMFTALQGVSAQTVTLTRQLDVGYSGSDVSALQEFLAQDISVYPRGLITGYYGSLTRDAVIKFQIKNGISAVGRVGPVTLQLINSQMSTSMSDVSAPIITNALIFSSRGGATISWTTAEQAKGKVYYSKTSFMVNEGTGVGSTGFYVSGNVVEETAYVNNHNVVLQNLESGTRYYYTIVSTDIMGNYNMTMVTNTFTTTQ